MASSQAPHERPDPADTSTGARVLALIPAHNEVATVRAVVAGALPHVDGVIVMDDGSTDGTAAALDGSGARVLRRTENRGKGDTLVEGFALAFGEGADAVITFDADRQHDPEDIPRFRAAALANPGALVLGDRSAELASMPRNRALGIGIGSVFVGWACARRIGDAQCGMRLYPARVWRETEVPRRETRGFRYETAILFHSAEAGIPFVAVPVAVRGKGYVVRPSHFHPVWDFLRLVGLVSGYLVRRWFRPRGLLIALGLMR